MAVFRAFYRNLGRILFVSVLCIMSQISYSFGDDTTGSKRYSVTYDCNGGTLASGTTSPQMVDTNGNVTLHNGDVCSYSGHDFYMWLCSATNVSSNRGYYGGETINLGSNLTCSAVWLDSCAPGERVWTDITGLGISLNEHPIVDGTGDGDVIFSNGGMVTLAGLCSQTSGTIQMTGNPSNVRGPNCWCRVVSVQPNGGQQSSISNAPWVLQSTGGAQTGGDCRLSNNGQWVDVECTYHCAKQTFVSDWDYYLNNLLFTQSCVYPTLTYHNCPDGGSYTDPAQQSLSANSGASVTLASSCVSGGVQVASPYTFGGWYCVDTGNNVSVFTGFPVNYNLTSDTDCYAIWNEIPCYPGQESRNSPEVLGVQVGNNASSNTEWSNGITLSNLFNPDTNGMNFDGWPDVSFNNGSWTVTFGAGLCSSSVGVPYQAGVPDETSPDGSNGADFCWCRVSRVNGEPLSDYPWVFSGRGGGCDPSFCDGVCSDLIGIAESDGELDTLLESLYSKNICEYSLTYNCNNGNNAQSALSGGYHEGGEQHVSLWSASGNNVGNCSVPSGYQFGGWTCNTTESPAVSVTVDNNLLSPNYNSINVMPSYNVVCTASWTALPRYNVTFAPGDSNNDGTGTSATGSTAAITNQLSGATITLPSNGFTAPSNYMFNGWNCNQGIGNKAVGATFSMPAAHVTCTAQWTPVPTYTLTYNCGTGGSGQEPIDQDGPYSAGSSATLAPDEGGCSNNGFPFENWYCEDSNGQWVPYSNNQITMDDNITCYATWNTEYTYTLTYDCGAGSGNPPGDQYGFNANVTLASNTCNNPSGYGFNGWLCYETAQGPLTNQSTFEVAGGSYYLGTDTTCVARWEGKNPCEPGTVVDKQMEVLGMLTDLPMNDNEPWQGTNITLGDLFDGNIPASDVTLWSPNDPSGPFGVGFSGGNGQWMVEIAGMCSSDQGTPGEQGNPTPNASGTYCWCSVDGYAPYNNNPSTGDVKPLTGYPWVYLAQWNGGNSFCSNDICAQYCTDIIDGEWEWMSWQNIQTDFWSYFLYSMYTKNICQYSLTYNCNNGNNAQSALSGGTYQGGEALLLNSNLCTVPSGQVFDYWSCDNNIGNLSGSIVNPTPYNNMICTAHWKNATYSLTYNCGIGSGGSWSGGSNFSLNAQTNTATVADAANHCTAPNGYQPDVTSWNCGGQNTSVNPGSSITITGNTTCTAQWTPLTTYTVTYHDGNCVPSASNYTDPTSISAGSSYTVLNPVISSGVAGFLPNISARYCVDFLGWSTSAYDSTQTPSNQVTYGNCTHSLINGVLTGDCGTINNVSQNIDLYAICEWSPYDVTYHAGNCNGYANYTDTDALVYGQLYSILTPNSVWNNWSSSGFQGWATAEHYDNNTEWCELNSTKLYPRLIGGNGTFSGFASSGTYNGFPGDKVGSYDCKDIDLYAVCCPLNLSWFLNGGQWPEDPNSPGTQLSNQTRCEWGVGAITPLRQPTRTGYTFYGWLVTGYDTP